ncbi:non-homologous end joining protein Ku [Prosthecomicrobium sp. N25]|uniref:non-homologous end joining protein Ku n=1 Tax=Prosthecomicrobium sp. N25 TaxID=3129254 RepID=UPI003076AA81
MAPRTFWKGYLKLSLVTCPVAMTPATTEAEHVRLHMLNRATGHRVRSHYVDSVTGGAVEDGDQVMGWPSGPDQYVMLEEDELDAIGLESTHTIDIERFVPKDQIDRLWLDGAHYLVPNDPVGEEAFSVIREAMAATGKVGISRLVLGRRERFVMLEARGKGIIVWTLRVFGEIRDEDAYFGHLGGEKPPAEQVDLAVKVIRERIAGFDADLLEDTRDAALEHLIAAKSKGRPPPAAEAPAEPKATNVVGIMDALRRSLAKETAAANDTGTPDAGAPAGKPKAKPRRKG